MHSKKLLKKIVLIIVICHYHLGFLYGFNTPGSVTPLCMTGNCPSLEPVLLPNNISALTSPTAQQLALAVLSVAHQPIAQNTPSTGFSQGYIQNEGITPHTTQTQQKGGTNVKTLFLPSLVSQGLAQTTQNSLSTPYVVPLPYLNNTKAPMPSIRPVPVPETPILPIPLVMVPLTQPKNLDASSVVVPLTQKTLQSPSNEIIDSFVFLQGPQLPQQIKINTPNGLSSLPLVNSQNQSVIDGNIFLQNVYVTLKNSSSQTIENNPVISAFPKIYQLAQTEKKQNIICYYKNGLLYVTYAANNFSYPNPMRNIHEIHMLNQLFSQDNLQGKYFIQMASKTNPEEQQDNNSFNLRTYVGQIVAVGTTIVPGDTLCVARYKVIPS